MADGADAAHDHQGPDHRLHEGGHAPRHLGEQLADGEADGVVEVEAPDPMRGRIGAGGGDVARQGGQVDVEQEGDDGERDPISPPEHLVEVAQPHPRVAQVAGDVPAEQGVQLLVPRGDAHRGVLHRLHRVAVERLGEGVEHAGHPLGLWAQLHGAEGRGRRRRLSGPPRLGGGLSSEGPEPVRHRLLVGAGADPPGHRGAARSGHERSVSSGRSSASWARGWGCCRGRPPRGAPDTAPGSADRGARAASPAGWPC